LQLTDPSPIYYISILWSIIWEGWVSLFKALLTEAISRFESLITLMKQVSLWVLSLLPLAYSLAVFIAIKISLIIFIMTGIILSSLAFHQASSIIFAIACKDFISQYYASFMTLLAHSAPSASIANESSSLFLFIIEYFPYLFRL
jgi:hypothetical protein